MHPEDALREARKVATALRKASTYLVKVNESNAALHLDEQVLHSPLTTVVLQAAGSAHKLCDYLAAHATTEKTTAKTAIAAHIPSIRGPAPPAVAPRSSTSTTPNGGGRPANPTPPSRTGSSSAATNTSLKAATPSWLARTVAMSGTCPPTSTPTGIDQRHPRPSPQ